MYLPGNVIHLQDNNMYQSNRANYLEIVFYDFLSHAKDHGLYLQAFYNLTHPTL